MQITKQQIEKEIKQIEFYLNYTALNTKEIRLLLNNVSVYMFLENNYTNYSEFKEHLIEEFYLIAANTAAILNKYSYDKLGSIFNTDHYISFLLDYYLE